MEAPNVVSACVMTLAHSVLGLRVEHKPAGWEWILPAEVWVMCSVERVHVSITILNLYRSRAKPTKYLGTHNGASVSGPEPFGAEIGG